MKDLDQAFAALPTSLRDELLGEYRSIVQNYSEHRWSPSELSGGKFCEIVYSILEGHAKSSYPAKSSKPKNFVDASRKLEANKHVPRSFQILIPRLLPALYEVRNNRGVGHVGGDVDPNHMDATFVMSTANWILAELVRVFHNLTPEEAQTTVDSIAERRIPLIWQAGSIKRVLDVGLNLHDQILVLVASTPEKTSASDLQTWTEYKNGTRFRNQLKQMHAERKIELSSDGKFIEILPPGSAFAAKIIADRTA